MTTPDEPSKKLSQSQQTAQQTARRLINARRAERPGNTPARTVADASDHLYRELSRWVGRDGCHALFARALGQAATEFPALKVIQLRPRSQPYVEGVAETIMAHGDPATAEGLERMLVRLVELLGRLIGEEMAMKLIERSLGASERSASGTRKEEA